MALSTAAPVPALAATLRERILLFVLFITVLSSSIAFIEPSPHDALMGVLAVACLIAGIRFHRIFALLLLLLLAWSFASLLALLNVAGTEKTAQSVAISIYLAVAALLFACLFAQNTMPRLAAMRMAYIAAALIAALAGIAGYFNLFPRATELFAPFGRALGTFKDPNVFGPFLIWPVLIVMERMLTRRIRFLDLAIVGILLLGLLLSFSRGAWFHFAVSSAVMLVFSIMAAPTAGARMRIFSLSAVGVVVLAGLLIVLLSFESIGTIFQDRAQLIKSYDVGQASRFQRQEIALGALLTLPNGMGPFVFSRLHGEQPHNVYLQVFMVAGWIGGMGYIVLLLSTLWVGLRTMMVRVPWQPYLITAYAAFVGVIAEGFVIDTDHWRHFFLLLGMIWGLAAASYPYLRGGAQRLV